MMNDLKHQIKIVLDRFSMFGEFYFDYKNYKKWNYNNPHVKTRAAQESKILRQTHRNEGKSVINIENLIDLNAIDVLCKKYRYVFVIKKHFYHENEDTSYTKSLNYILDVTRDNIDAQEMLKYSDVLITDYSGCYIDYLLLDRPILFYAYDLEQYLQKDRKMNFSYEEAAAGPIIQDKETLSREIERVMLGIDDYKSLRYKVKHIFYNDETSTYSGTKVLEFIQNL